MINNKYVLALSLVLLLLGFDRANAQNTEKTVLRFDVALQSDMHWATQKDADPRFMSNTYVSTKLRYDKYEAGLRYEYLKQALPGFESAKGNGFANLYLKGTFNKFQFTLGSFYEQFGSGMLLRLYEDRALGIDNSLFGAKFIYKPIEAIRIKALAGMQRNHFDDIIAPRGVFGADVEYDIFQHLAFLRDNGYIVQIGAGYVTKLEEQDETLLSKDFKYLLNQPNPVGAFSTRLHVLKGNFDLFGEYALKANDPNLGNNYSFGKGSVGMLNLSYADRGLSLTMGARRSENFDFRSVRTASETDLRISHLLPFTQQRTYALAALYPYATQSKGEWAFQGELRYRLKKRTWYGGRYGTDIRLTASYVTGLQAKNPAEEDLLLKGDLSLRGTNGVATNVFGFGRKLFHDFGIELSRKVNKHYSFSLLYSNQSYNQKVLEGEADNGNPIKSHIFIYDGKHKLSRRFGLRTELQYSHSKQALGDWLYAGAELSILPHFLISASDQYNIDGKHYPMVSVAGTYKGHRLQLSYGKTRAGINCSGGVCRYMPATEGFYLSYNLTP